MYRTTAETEGEGLENLFKIPIPFSSLLLAVPTRYYCRGFSILRPLVFVFWRYTHLYSCLLCFLVCFVIKNITLVRIDVTVVFHWGSGVTTCRSFGCMSAFLFLCIVIASKGSNSSKFIDLYPGQYDIRVFRMIFEIQCLIN